MRITPPDAECVQKAADALRVTDEPSASKLVVELRERGEWAAEEKRYALRRRAADEIDRLRAALERYGRHEHPNCHDLTLKEDGSFGPRNGCLCGLDAVLSGRSAPETRKQPETPVAWFRWGGSAIKPVIAWGNWPPPEPDDVAWYPLYSTPEGRPAQETTDQSRTVGEHQSGVALRSPDPANVAGGPRPLPEKASAPDWVTITVQCAHCGAFASSPESCNHTVGCPTLQVNGRTDGG